ncbi:MAG TPA: AtpZ/AtpI family protein [Chloroflexota bacterium]
MRNDQFTVLRAFALVGQFGVSLGVFVAIGVYGGEQLDAHFHSAPLYTLVCIFAGLIVGTIGGVQLIRLSLRRGAS